MAYGWYDWRPYVPVAVRRRNAARAIARFRKKAGPIAPVVIQGRTIAQSFWGKAWCDTLESYSDFANRLPRGRTYVRNGSVLDLQLGPGTVKALVSGSTLYRIAVAITPLPKPRWQAVVRECAGKIGSLVELLQGKLSRAVMEVLIRPQAGLFPSAKEIAFECSCPDWAAMCKHVAATLYGVGARLDTEPELFFRLRRVDQLDLLTAAGSGAALATPSAGGASGSPSPRWPTCSGSSWTRQRPRGRRRPERKPGDRGGGPRPPRRLRRDGLHRPSRRPPGRRAGAGRLGAPGPTGRPGPRWGHARGVGARRAGDLANGRLPAPDHPREHGEHRSPFAPRGPPRQHAGGHPG